MLTPSQTSSAVVPAQKKTGKSKGTKKARAQRAIVRMHEKRVHTMKSTPKTWVQVLRGVAIVAGSVSALVAFFILAPVATAAGIAAASAIAPKATKLMMTS